MMRQLARRAAIAAVPLIALPVLALAVAPGAALASTPSATLQLVGQAQLQPDGEVFVTLNYSCSPGFGQTAILDMAVMQPGSNIGGSAINNAACDGQKHIVTMAAPGPYTLGTTSVLAWLEKPSGLIFEQVQYQLKVH